MDEIEQALASLTEYLQTNTMGIEEQQALISVLGELNDLINAPIEAEIPTSAGLLWHISGGNPQVFTEYLRQVPDQALNAIGANPFALRQTINRLAQNQPQQRNREIDGIPQAPLQSSNVWGFRYDPRNQKLFVRFQGDGVYEYENVPPHIYQIFSQGAIPAKTNGRNQYGQWWVGKTPSIGASLFELIKKGGYAFSKVA